MFDISFTELLIIAVVALLVIGPEKLPKVARTAGAFFGRLQRFVAQVKDEVGREARFEELQRLEEEVQSSLQQGVMDLERSLLPDAVAFPDTSVEQSAPQKPPRTRRLNAAQQASVGNSAEKPQRRKARDAAQTSTTKKSTKKPATAKRPAMVQSDMWQVEQADAQVVRGKPRKSSAKAKITSTADDAATVSAMPAPDTERSV